MTRPPATASDAWGMWLIEVHGLPVEAWLQRADVNAFDGRGDFIGTADPAQARRFASLADVLACWKERSTVRPVRPDGRPNRPLTAFTIEPRRLT